MLTSSQLCKFLMKFESSYDSCYTYQVSCPLYNYFIEKLEEANLPYPPEHDGEIPPGIGLNDRIAGTMVDFSAPHKLNDFF